jgi:hypothetical protein
MMAALAVLSGTAGAQIIDPGTPPTTSSMSYPGGAYYNFSSGSGCDLSVSVWGYVRNPGRYKIPCETNLLELLSYCQLGNVEPYLWKVKIVRKGGAENTNEIREVFEVDLAKYLTVKGTSMSTTELLLFPGDLVIVDGEPVFHYDWLLRIAQIVTAIASILTSMLAIYTIIDNTGK